MTGVHIVLAGPFRDPQRFLKGIIVVLNVLLEKSCICTIPVCFKGSIVSATALIEKN